MKRNDEWSETCKLLALEAAYDHARWAAWDRRWERILLAALILLPAMSLIHAIRGEYWGQACHVILSVVVRAWLHEHMKSYKTTQGFLECRQRLLDLANG